MLCMPPPSVAHLVNGRLCKGAYVGPEVASASHWVRVQLNRGISHCEAAENSHDHAFEL